MTAALNPPLPSPFPAPPFLSPPPHPHVGARHHHPVHHTGVACDQGVGAHGPAQPIQQLNCAQLADPGWSTGGGVGGSEGG